MSSTLTNSEIPTISSGSNGTGQGGSSIMTNIAHHKQPLHETKRITGKMLEEEYIARVISNARDSVQTMDGLDRKRKNQLLAEMHPDVIREEIKRLGGIEKFINDFGEPIGKLNVKIPESGNSISYSHSEITGAKKTATVPAEAHASIEVSAAAVSEVMTPQKQEAMDRYRKILMEDEKAWQQANPSKFTPAQQAERLKEIEASDLFRSFDDVGNRIDKNGKIVDASAEGVAQHQRETIAEHGKLNLHENAPRPREEVESGWLKKLGIKGKGFSEEISRLGENYKNKFLHEESIGQRVLTQTSAFMAASVGLGVIIDTARGKKVLVDDGQGNLVQTTKHDLKAGAEGIALAAGIASLGLINVAGKVR